MKDLKDEHVSNAIYFTNNFGLVFSRASRNQGDYSKLLRTTLHLCKPNNLSL